MVTKIFEEGPHSVRLGEEYDEVLLWLLMQILLDEKAKLVDQNGGMVGSQEITVKEFQIGQDTLKVRTETYMGTTLHGPEPLVERIARVVKERLPTAPLSSRHIELYKIHWPSRWEPLNREASAAWDARLEAGVPADRLRPYRRCIGRRMDREEVLVETGDLDLSVLVIRFPVEGKPVIRELASVEDWLEEARNEA
jgi:hypothetical protein